MIGTVTLNPCIDKSIAVEELKRGKLNRIRIIRNDFSGKGVNVSAVVRQLGKETHCALISFRDGHELAKKTLESMGIHYSYALSEGSLRINTKVYEERNGEMTELNEAGHLVDDNCLKNFLDVYQKMLHECDVIVISGSVPQGVPTNIYRDLVRMAKEANVTVVLDAEKELMISGIAEKPYLIKPNLFELETTFGIRAETPQEILRAGRDLISKYGVSIVCITMGEQGAMIVNKDEAFLAPRYHVAAKGLQGAGDSMVAGISIAIEKGLSLEEMLRYGTAAAVGSIMREGTQLCTLEDFLNLLTKVVVEPITI